MTQEEIIENYCLKWNLSVPEDLVLALERYVTLVID